MVIVRKELFEDIDAIRQINEEAFGQSLEADIVDALRVDCVEFLSFVAEVDGKVVGYILFTPVLIETDGEGIEGAGLAPMAVLPEYQRQGVGSMLVEEGLNLLQETGCPFVVVLGHAHYYSRFGFEPASRYDIRSEWAVPDGSFMIIVFDESQFSGISGVARYRPEFS
jgi:putative acetyltransferase